MVKERMKFKIKDNFGNIHISDDYDWDKEDGIPNEETLLEHMDENFCSCIPNENTSYCDCESQFDNGEVIEWFT